MWPRVVLVDLKCDLIGTRFEIVMVSSRADCEQYVPAYLPVRVLLSACAKLYNACNCSVRNV